MAESTIYQLLQHDHREVEDMFKQIQGAEGGRGGQAESLLEKLTQELVQHMDAEEKTFYEAMKKEPEGKDLVAEGLKEHREARGMIKNMSGNPGDAVWLQKVKGLEQAIQHHVEEEEGKMFPAARKMVDQKEAVAIGTRFESTKKAGK